MAKPQRGTRLARNPTARKPRLATSHGREAGAQPKTAAHERHAKDDFQLLRLALHEMRNPLTSVQLNGQLIERSMVKLGLEKERRLSAMIVSSARKLDSLTQDLGDVARLRSGGSASAMHVHDLSRLLPEILSHLAETLDSSRIRLAIPVGPLPILADARLLDRILGNLLSIALRYDAGQAGIDLHVGVNKTEIVFAATVPALPDAARMTLAAPSDSELGLGFLVARIMVEDHGGKLESRPGPAGELVLRFSLPSAACA
jgi:K+-sensing histidine kinase KdpD